mmetsp:Transcript_17012/g.33244  ORF Transcript_17012/g.33244 Transcript_17012/m.33244 type:complete len:285 (+) Transcript_17012:1819-2673(+)
MVKAHKVCLVLLIAKLALDKCTNKSNIFGIAVNLASLLLEQSRELRGGILCGHGLSNRRRCYRFLQLVVGRASLAKGLILKDVQHSIESCTSSIWVPCAAVFRNCLVDDILQRRGIFERRKRACLLPSKRRASVHGLAAYASHFGLSTRHCRAGLHAKANSCLLLHRGHFPFFRLLSPLIKASPLSKFPPTTCRSLWIVVVSLRSFNCTISAQIPLKGSPCSCLALFPSLSRSTVARASTQRRSQRRRVRLAPLACGLAPCRKRFAAPGRLAEGLLDASWLVLD